MRRRHFLAAPLVLAAVSAPAQPLRVREFELVAMPGEALKGAGPRPVPAWTYGGKVPGPEIRARQGERLRVTVTNRLDRPTTVHWHGVRVPHAMDGVPHLTQPPIEPGGRFVYEFDLADAGTFWYHSHLQSAEQQDRGLHGTLIVEERMPLDVHRDVTWVLDDWRITQAGEISDTFGDRHDMTHAGRIGNVITVNGSVAEEFPVRPGERIRLRLVNVANARIFALRFPSLSPKVIAIDGHPVQPHDAPAAGVVLAPGMRCDLLVEMTGRDGEKSPVQDVFYRNRAYVLMDFVHRRGETPPALPPSRPLAPNPLAEPDVASATVHVVRFQGGAMGSLHTALLDGQPMDLRSLVRHGKAWAVNGVASSDHHMPPAVTLDRGRSYLFKLRNDTSFDHPIHLHGHVFRVLRRNGRDAPHREWSDTVLLRPNDEADVAFVADNPGDWMLHCHVLEHMEGGMMAVVRVR